MRRYRTLALKSLILFVLLALLAALVSPIVYPRCAKALDSVSVIAPTPVISTTTLTATCNFNSTLGAWFQYAVGQSAGETDVRGWTDLGLNSSPMLITAAGLSLTNGQTYYISVHGRENELDLWSDSVSSNAIIVQAVDVTPPTIPVVTDDGATTANRTQLHATWSASDPESGITRYEYAIGTSIGGTDVVGFTNVGTQTSVTRTGLSLPPLPSAAVYYFTVRAYSAGGQSQGSSDGITVAADTTPPTTPAVTDDGEYTTNTTSCHASWSAAQDLDSGVTEYRYAIGRERGQTDIVGWTSTGTGLWVTHTLGAALALGTSYYFSVVAVNGSGLLSTPPGYSDGITVVDTSSPLPVAITVENGRQYTNNTTRLSFAWSASAHPSGIREYSIAIGSTQPSPSNPGAWRPEVVGWKSVGNRTVWQEYEDVNLQNGATYYVGVRVRSNSGQETTSFSNGIKVDTTSPTEPVVTDDGDYTASATELHAFWTCEDPESGIAEIQYAIGTAPGGIDIINWSRVDPPTATEYRWTNLSLVPGLRYYISIRVRNGAERWSQAATSDGITVDATMAPVVSSISPSRGNQGQTLTIIVSGTRFSAGATLNLGDKLTVTHVNVDGPTRITATLAIAGDAVLGPRDVLVTTAHGTSRLVSGFTVLQASTSGPDGTPGSSSTPGGNSNSSNTVAAPSPTGESDSDGAIAGQSSQEDSQEIQQEDLGGGDSVSRSWGLPVWGWVLMVVGIVVAVGFIGVFALRGRKAQ